jgi:hypothetical protein
MKGFQPLVCKKEVVELTQNFCEWLSCSNFRFRLTTNKWTNVYPEKEVTFDEVYDKYLSDLRQSRSGNKIFLIEIKK